MDNMKNIFREVNKAVIDTIEERKRKNEVHLDAIRGCLFGGAAGDALGYPIEFYAEEEIFSRYGIGGLEHYEVDAASGKALISDDTQMSLFTGSGLLIGDTRGMMRGIRALPHSYVALAYQGWLWTQECSYENRKAVCEEGKLSYKSWLLDVPELYSRRAPGNTCLSALAHLRDIADKGGHTDDYIHNPFNDSKGCGGIMRVAPLGLRYSDIDIETLDEEGAQIAAITHGHSLGYMTAAVLVHIINRIVYSNERNLKNIILEAKSTVLKIFNGDAHIKELENNIDLAVELSENSDTDLNNIHRLGEGWVAEETLGIAIYCSLKYQNDFSKGITVAANHKGDSDSTAAVTGNILGAYLGFEQIEEKWKKDLEIADVIIEMADDLCHGCQMTEYGHYYDPYWIRKYMKMHWRQCDMGYDD